MTQEQNTTSQPLERHSAYSTRAQERQEQRLAKQAARAERRAAPAQRPRHDWTFEVQAGEKVYTFSWHWHPADLHIQVADEAETSAPEVSQ